MPSSRSIVIGVVVATLGAGLFSIVESGCGGDVDATHYGPAGGLRNLVPRGTDPSGDGGSAPPTGGTDGGSSEGSSLCNGAGPIDGGVCAIKWSTDIYPKMQATGAWKCTDAACHGSANSGIFPPFDATSSSTAYGQLVAYLSSANGNKPYINPCSIDPAASTFVCNTVTPQNTACGIQGMPSTAAPPGGALLSTSEQADLLTWVKCGSPEN